MSRQYGTSVYGRLITKQQPSLLAWTQVLDFRLGGTFVIAQKIISILFLEKQFQYSNFQSTSVASHLS